MFVSSEFVSTECLYFDTYAQSNIDDVLAEDGGLLQVLPLAVHLKFVVGQVGFLGFRVWGQGLTILEQNFHHIHFSKMRLRVGLIKQFVLLFFGKIPLYCMYLLFSLK